MSFLTRKVLAEEAVAKRARIAKEAEAEKEKLYIRDLFSFT